MQIICINLQSITVHELLGVSYVYACSWLAASWTSDQANVVDLVFARVLVFRELIFCARIKLMHFSDFTSVFEVDQVAGRGGSCNVGRNPGHTRL